MKKIFEHLQFIVTVATLVVIIWGAIAFYNNVINRDLTRDLNQKSASIKELKNKTSILETELKQKAEKNAELKRQYSEMISEIEAIKKKNKIIKSKNAELTTRISFISGEHLAKIVSERAKLISQNDSLFEKIAEYQNERDRNIETLTMGKTHKIIEAHTMGGSSLINNGKFMETKEIITIYDNKIMELLQIYSNNTERIQKLDEIIKTHYDVSLLLKN